MIRLFYSLHDFQLIRRVIIAKEEKNTELVRKKEAHPVSTFGEMENYYDKFFHHPFSLMARLAWPGFDFPKLEEVSPSVDIFEEKGLPLGGT